MSTETDEKGLVKHRADVALSNVPDEEITSIEDVVKAYGGELVSSTELGEWGPVLRGDDKAQLVGVTFAVFRWGFFEGANFEGDGVSVDVVTEDGRKFRIIDTGTGIRAELDDFTRRTGRSGGMLVRKGLVRSEYRVNDEGKPDKNGKQKAWTYYLDSST